ncbi:protein cup isoform X1 [Drosophila mauritiana]|uniref:Protein cup isoform X1 n=1 Tax=Drosophila mauritiana TaxID=7226 RepID=A0A6P8KGH5_DROMA|nr:protein cup isoform X1 [Drosophila mauritiana]XP_033168355.1 protein cup isoform X1 [Drosophila mauritiana]XP_033168356.1 protein cup isoform X1 [Drosophila mauritiana]
MDTSKLSARYSKVELLALRYEGKSRQRPQCSTRLELQTLGFWKINLNTAALNVSSTYSNQNKNRLSPEADNSSLICSNSSSLSSRRAMRNRERANNYYQRFVPTDSVLISGEDKDKDAPSHGQPYKSNIIDHRSISSSYLMPAFAKRRFVISKGSNSEESNEGINTCASKGKAPSSPRRKGSELDTAETCLNFVQPDHDQCMSSSPTFSTSRQERRIGSGRLLPRSDNWDYKNQKTVEASIENEKETSPNGSGSTSGLNQHNQSQHRSRTFSGRLVERVPEVTDRRFQYDSKKSVDRQGINNRRISGKEPFSTQSRSKRANSYLIHEEPEWFSAGPTSQLETIDLHGFEDLENNEERSVGDKNDQIQQLHKNLATQASIDEASMRNSNDSLNLREVNPGDEIKHTDENIVNFIQNSTDLGHPNKNKPIQKQSSQNPESEFNFDAFLNMHPLDNSLLSNDETGKSEAKGTSRFSRWFRQKEAANNNEFPGFRESHTQEKRGIPSVKDLEAQMTKVDMRTDLINPIAGSFCQTVQMEKPIARDTEAFKKLLQQLGSQARQQHPCNDDCRTINLSNIANHVQLESKLHQKKNDGHLQQPELSVNVPTMPTSSHVFLQKRLEIQHLIQRLHCGDVSHELLEKELANPSTPAATKDVIASVLSEYSHSKRSPVVTGDPNIFTQQFQPQSVHQHYSQELHSQNTANHTINQLISHGNSPTPLAFTPTSVLRKMTADKDTQSPSTYCQNPQYHVHQQNAKQLGTRESVLEPQLTATMAVQPRMILGGGNFAIGQNNQQLSPNMSQSRNQQVLKWTSGNMQMVHGKTFGRPILKGGLNSMPHCNSALPLTAHKIEMQPTHQPHLQHQQLRFKADQSVESNLNTENVHQNIASPVGWHQLYLQHQQQHHHTRQQPRQRVIYGEMHRQSNTEMSPPVPGFSDSSDSGNVIKTNSLTSPSYQRDERISSPTNQLAQWFSPELLARASAGKLPLLNVNQALSLEEFERSIQHSSGVVHN